MTRATAHLINALDDINEVIELTTVAGMYNANVLLQIASVRIECALECIKKPATGTEPAAGKPKTKSH